MRLWAGLSNPTTRAKQKNDALGRNLPLAQSPALPKKRKNVHLSRNIPPKTPETSHFRDGMSDFIHLQVDEIAPFLHPQVYESVLEELVGLEPFLHLQAVEFAPPSFPKGNNPPDYRSLIHLFTTLSPTLRRYQARS